MARLTSLFVLFISLFLTLGQCGIWVYPDPDYKYNPGKPRYYYDYDAKKLDQGSIRITSVKVDAGEEWELYTKEDFTGKLKVVSRNFPELHKTDPDFNDRILSIRKGTAENKPDYKPPKGIVLYWHPDYRGPFLKLKEEEPLLTHWKYKFMNDQATSVKVAPGEVWELFTDPHYKGERKVVTGNVPELNKSDRRMNDKISSVRGGIILYSDNHYRGKHEYTSGNVGLLKLNDKVYSAKVYSKNHAYLLYADENYSGDCYYIDSNDASLPDRVRKTSSIKRIPKNYGLVLWEHGGYNGECAYITKDQKSMNLEGDARHLNDKVSSLKVLSGGWELYQHPNKRGACWFFSENTSNVPSGILDQVSSIYKVVDGKRDDKCKDGAVRCVPGKKQVTIKSEVAIKDKTKLKFEINESTRNRLGITSKTKIKAKNLFFEAESELTIAAETESITNYGEERSIENDITVKIESPSDYINPRSHELRVAKVQQTTMRMDFTADVIVDDGCKPTSEKIDGTAKVTGVASQTIVEAALKFGRSIPVECATDEEVEKVNFAEWKTKKWCKGIAKTCVSNPLCVRQERDTGNCCPNDEGIWSSCCARTDQHPDCVKEFPKDTALLSSYHCPSEGGAFFTCCRDPLTSSSRSRTVSAKRAKIPLKLRSISISA